MRKKSSSTIEAEKAFAADVYRDRAAINRKAQAVLVSGSRQITIRLGNDELALARRQAEARGLKYQTYIKMLLHEALRRNRVVR
jgi:predicted DNA binding CopG/RHH family protein